MSGVASKAKTDEAGRRGQDTAISRHRRELERRNRDRVAVFQGEHFGIFRNWEVMLLMGGSVREREQMGDSAQSVLARYKASLPNPASWPSCTSAQPPQGARLAREHRQRSARRLAPPERLRAAAACRCVTVPLPPTHPRCRRSHTPPALHATACNPLSTLDVPAQGGRVSARPAAGGRRRCRGACVLHSQAAPIALRMPAVCSTLRALCGSRS